MQEVTALLVIERLGADGVELIDEDDGRGLLLRECKGVADGFSAFPYHENL
jgi:hypothetical protein